MSLRLTSAELEKLSRATELLLSPLDHPDVDLWRSAVNRQLRGLLHADSAGFLLPVPDRLPLYSDEHDPAELAKYTEYPPPPRLDGVPLFERMVQLGVMTARSVYGDEYGDYLSSAYYNEYAAPNGARDTLAAAVPVTGGPPGLASLQLWRSRVEGGRWFGEREAALLRLLFPAFRAGVETHARWGRQGDDLGAMLEAMGQPAALFDAAGELVHSTRALEAVLAADPLADLLRTRLRATAEALRRAIRRKGEAGAPPPRRVVRDVRTRLASYRLYGCIAREGPAGAALVVVGLERVTPALPSVRRLRERFGLTRRQAQVALLLARRLSNAEIAERLVISPHTALRHTEAVLAKLGLGDRRLVAEALREPEG